MVALRGLVNPMSWVAGLPLPAKSWQVRTDSQTAGEVLVQHANQLRERTRALLAHRGPPSLILTQFRLTKVVIWLSGRTSARSCQACCLAEGCCQRGVGDCAGPPEAPGSALWWAAKEAGWRGCVFREAPGEEEGVRDGTGWMLDGQGVSMCVCWTRSRLTQTPAAGPQTLLQARGWTQPDRWLLTMRKHW